MSEHEENIKELRATLGDRWEFGTHCGFYTARPKPVRWNGRLIVRPYASELAAAINKYETEPAAHSV